MAALRYSLPLIPLLSCWAAALPAAEPDEEPAVLVISAERSASPLYSGSQATTVVELDRLEQGQILQATDGLLWLPGLMVQHTPGGTDIFQLRGASNAETQILIDGIPYNDATVVAGELPLVALPLSAAALAEVLPGAQPLWGNRAVGGVVALRSAAPSAQHESFARAEAGNYGTVAGLARASGPLGEDFGYALAVSGMRRDGWSLLTDDSDGDPGSHERDGMRRLDAAGRLQWNVADGALWLSGFVLESRHEYDSDFIGPDDRDSARELDSWRLAAGGRHPLAEDLEWSWDAARTVNKGKYDSFDFPTTGTDDYLAIRLRWQLSAPLALQVGGDLLRQRAELGGFAPIDERHQLAGGHVLASWKTASYDLDATLRIEEHSEEGDALTWRLGGAVWALPQTLRLRASAATGFRVPTIYQQFASPETEPLDAESSLGWEFGLDWRITRDLRFAASYWQTRFEDRINFIGSDPDWNPIYSNDDGRAKVSGLTAELRQERSAELPLELALGYTYITAKNATGDTPRFQPRHRATLRGTGYLLDDRVWGGLAWQWSHDYESAGGTVGTWHRLDAQAGWRIDETFALTLRGINVLDRAYTPNIGYSGEPLQVLIGGEARY